MTTWFTASKFSLDLVSQYKNLSENLVLWNKWQLFYLYTWTRVTFRALFALMFRRKDAIFLFKAYLYCPQHNTSRIFWQNCVRIIMKKKCFPILFTYFSDRRIHTKQVYEVLENKIYSSKNLLTLKMFIDIKSVFCNLLKTKWWNSLWKPKSSTLWGLDLKSYQKSNLTFTYW